MDGVPDGLSCPVFSSWPRHGGNPHNGSWQVAISDMVVSKEAFVRVPLLSLLVYYFISVHIQTLSKLYFQMVDCDNFQWVLFNNLNRTGTSMCWKSLPFHTCVLIILLSLLWNLPVLSAVSLFFIFPPQTTLYIRRSYLSGTLTEGRKGTIWAPRVRALS